MDYHIEKVASANAEVGEGPVWNPEEKKVYWTDIAGGKLFKYDPASGSNETIHNGVCLLYTSPSPRDLSTSRMPSSA